MKAIKPLYLSQRLSLDYTENGLIQFTWQLDPLRDAGTILGFKEYAVFKTQRGQTVSKAVK